MITRNFPTLFLRQGLRALLRHPVLLLLNILSITLGVAVFLAIQIANRSANESFRAGVELVTGRANLEVHGPIDEMLYPAISALDGVQSATPLVEGVVTLPDYPGEYLRIVGIDPFSGSGLRTFELLGTDRDRIDLEKWLREPNAIAVSKDYAQRVLPKIGNPIRVRAGNGRHDLRPIFEIDPSTASGDPRIAAMDIGWAQELLQQPGHLSAILLLVVPEKLETVRSAIRRLVPADIEVDSPKSRSGQIESMLGAFQLNLTALSLVSVLVGAFLIYNTISASVVRRRIEIGILRALGATRAEVRVLFLGEAAVSGIIGIALGAALALPLASALSAPLTRTIRNLYVLTSVERLYLSPWQFAQALAVGIGVTLLAAWVPASEAARTNPARALHPGSIVNSLIRTSVRWLMAGILLLAAAAVIGWMTLYFRLPLLGFASAFCVFAGFSMLTPAAISASTWMLRTSPRYVRLAASNLARAMHRNAITIAALASAIAMTVGISVMTHSFRASVDDWINSTLVDDLFIGPANDEVRTALPPKAEEWIAAQSGVKQVASRAYTTVRWRDETVTMAVVNGSRSESLRFLGSNPKEQFQNFLADDTVVVSEPFANRFGVRWGDWIHLPAPHGPAAFRIAGIFQDYARSGGLILIQRRNFERHWDPLPAQALALELEAGIDPNAIGEAFRARFSAEGEFSIFSNRALRARIFDIFDQTFSVTLILRMISIIVAAAGVMLSLLILTAEREREIGVLRALGASRAQVVGLFLREACLIGVVASAVGIASGACLAMVLTWVVNKAFFGWTIQLSYPLEALLATPLWIILVAVLAALPPAWRAARVPPAHAVRFE